ncbi:MAG: tetratricopeptide repeat protein [Spirochaetales bacterium]|nr:tetratricopeptide repeat protein [Spirochaetales bacterium]
MEKYFLTKFGILTFFILLLCIGCGFNEPLIEIVDGNYRFMRGDYTGATISYIKALEKQSHEEWIYYNLGNVYNALGETNAAIEELTRATKSTHPEVLFRTHFNLGNIYYRLGKYEKAIDHFKSSLKAKQNEIDAKINLELAVDKMEKEKSIKQNELSIKKDEKVNDNTEDSQLLEYIKQREALIWRSLNQPAPVNREINDW